MPVEPSEYMENDADCHALLDYLKVNRGFDFLSYKQSSLKRRLHVSMQSVGVETYGEYIDYLEVHPDGFAHLFDTLLINVTSFFRDPVAWEAIESVVLPNLLASAGSDGPIRIWSAGCASGQEPYTLVMLLAEKIGTEGVRERVKVYATDLDEGTLHQARLAVYPARAVASVPEDLLAKYFRPSGAGYAFHGDLRRSVIFGRHDLIHDAPISHIDLLTCRNTLMYFNTEVQTKVLTRFNFAMNPEAYLMLGKAEMLFTHSSLFVPIDLKRRIFTKVPRANLPNRVIQMQNKDSEDQANLSPLANLQGYKALFDISPSPQLLVDRNGIIVLINSRARNMFRLSERDQGRPLQDLEISYRPADLRSLIDQTYQERRAVSLSDIPYTMASGTNLDIHYLEIQVAPLIEVSTFIAGVAITFIDLTRSKRLQDELHEANRELSTAYEELQSSNEELETTNEELQSTVEELETTNEELQSTNEELETMNEELQSTNEELQTINDELRQRSAELNEVNLFVTTVLSSLRAAVVVVDSNMKVKVWNNLSEDLWGLRSDEVLGRHFLTLDIGLPVDQLKVPIRAALAGEAPSAEVTLEAMNRRGKTLEYRIVASALKNADGEAHGVLLTMDRS